MDHDIYILFCFVLTVYITDIIVFLLVLLLPSVCKTFTCTWVPVLPLLDNNNDNISTVQNHVWRDCSYCNSTAITVNRFF